MMNGRRPQATPDRPPKVTAGQASSAAAAFCAYAPRLRAYVLKRMRQPAEVDDLTQEIFERFLRVDRMERVRNPLHYLFGIASNVVSDTRLAEERSPVTYDSQALDSITDHASHAVPDDMAERVSMAQELRFALSLLPDTHRAVLLLIKRDGLSYAEAARRMNLTISTVTSYAFEARAKVKMILKHRQG